MKLTWSDTAEDRPPSLKQLRNFGYTVGIGLPVILGWLLPALAGHGFHTWTLWVGIPAIFTGCVAPSKLNTPYRVWMAIGYALACIETHIILSIVFIVVLQPIALALKLLGNDLLRSKKQPGQQSYREIRANDHTDLTRIF